MLLRCVWSASLVGAALTVIACGPSSTQPSPESSQTVQSVAQTADDHHIDIASSPPVALCQNVTVTATNTCTLPASINNGSYDPDGDLVGCTQSPAGPYAIGTTTAVTLTCADSTGRTSNCTGSVTVTDKVIPVVSVTPQTQTIQCIANAAYTYLTGVSATDLCQGTLPSSSITPYGTVNLGQAGTYPVAYQAKDSANNLSATVTRTVTVVDTLRPSLTLMGGSTVAQECGSAFTDPGYQSNDQCRGVLTGSVVKTGTVNTAVVGLYTIRYDVSDGINSALPVTRTVNVTDTLKPTVTLTGPLAQTLECGAPFQDSGVSATDQCAGNLSVVAINPPNPNLPGTYVTQYKATDPSGNTGTSSQSRTFTVADTLPPAVTLNGSANINLECATPYVDPGATASDLCVGSVPVTTSGSVNPMVLGAQTLTYSASDGRGHSGSKMRTVTVSDTLPPVLTLLGSASQALECGTSYVDPGATASDLCSGSLPVVAINPPNPNKPGIYVTQYKATDPSGNTGTASQSRTVTVTDTLPPTLTLNGPDTVSLECGSPFQDPGASASDLCAGTLPVTTSSSVNTMLPGVQAITYSANDGSGHSVSRTRTVTISDTLPPVLTLLGPASQALECDGTPYVDPGATASDTCSGDLTSSIVTSNNLDQSLAGNYSITYSVQDAAGHTSTAVRQLTVSPCVTCVSLHLSDYTLFLSEDYTGGHDVEGKVAAGGTITLTDFAVGVRVADNNIANTLVAGGDLTLSRGGVWGDAWYGGSYSSNPSVVFPRGTVAHGTPIDFAARFAELRHQSARLAALPAHGVTKIEPWGGIMLRGTDPSLNVFDVSASAFTGAALWSIDAPAGSLVVVNIRGASATFTGFGTFFSGGIDQHGVLYNFVDATEINAQGFGFWGTVLAPQAHVHFSNGSWDGGIYARSLTGNAEGHVNPLTDRDVCP